MFDVHTDEVIARQVAHLLGCRPADLAKPGVLVVSHGAWLGGYTGVYGWLMGSTAIVSAPLEWVDRVRHMTAGHTADDLLSAEFWHAHLGPALDRIVGPSYQGYVDAAAFRRAADTDARLLTATDRLGLERLAAACPPIEWEHSSIGLDQAPIFGLERDGELLAAAACAEKGPGVVTVGVITHPDHRGRGYGRAVVSGLTAYGLDQGLVLHYQTLRTNVGSVAIARSLGYHDIASAMAMRLRQVQQI